MHTNDPSAITLTTEEWGQVDQVARLAWDLAEAHLRYRIDRPGSADAPLPVDGAEALEGEIRARVIAMIGASR